MILTDKKGNKYHLPELASPKEVGKGIIYYFFNMAYIGNVENGYFTPYDQRWYFSNEESIYKAILPK